MLRSKIKQKNRDLKILREFIFGWMLFFIFSIICCTVFKLTILNTLITKIQHYKKVVEVVDANGLYPLSYGRGGMALAVKC